MLPDKSTLEYLGQGVYTDKTLVYKFGDEYQKTSLSDEAKALERILGIQNTQKIVEFDVKKNIIISKYIPGYHLDETSNEFQTGVVPYTDSQLEQLFDTLVQMKQKGVYFEPHARNLIYDKNNGFTPIDYGNPIEPTIFFEDLYYILSLNNIPIKTVCPLEVLNKSGLHQDKHEDLLERMIEAFKKVDLDEANIAIERYQNKMRFYEEMSKSLEKISNPYVDFNQTPVDSKITIKESDIIQDLEDNNVLKIGLNFKNSYNIKKLT